MVAYCTNLEQSDEREEINEMVANMLMLETNKRLFQIAADWYNGSKLADGQ